MKTLRIAHIADTHLGYKSNTLPARDEDFVRSWIHACNAIVDSSPDIIIHAGDVFHSARPDWKALTAYTTGIYKLLEAGVPIFIIAGNHDSSALLIDHTVFTFTESVLPKIVSTNHNEPSVYRLDQPEVDIMLVPHRALMNPDLTILVQERLPPKSPERHRILVSHGSIAKDDPTTEMGSIIIPHEITEHGWDYIALGHLHMAQPYGQRGWYSGSTERCGWSDQHGSPAWCLTTLHADGKFSHVQQPVPYMEMFGLPDVDCTDRADVDILEAVQEAMRSIQFPDDRSNLRVRLNNVPKDRKRRISDSIHRFVRRDHPQVALTLVTEAAHLLNDGRQYDGPLERGKKITDYYQDFVEEAGFDSAWKEYMNTVGLGYLEDAIAEDVDATA